MSAPLFIIHPLGILLHFIFVFLIAIFAFPHDDVICPCGAGITFHRVEIF